MFDFEIKFLTDEIERLQKMIGVHFFARDICHFARFANKSDERRTAIKARYFDNIIQPVTIKSGGVRQQNAVAFAAFEFVARKTGRLV